MESSSGHFVPVGGVLLAFLNETCNLVTCLLAVEWIDMETQEIVDNDWYGSPQFIASMTVNLNASQSEDICWGGWGKQGLDTKGKDNCKGEKPWCMWLLVIHVCIQALHEPFVPLWSLVIWIWVGLFGRFWLDLLIWFLVAAAFRILFPLCRLTGYLAHFLYCFAIHQSLGFLLESRWSCDCSILLWDSRLVWQILPFAFLSLCPTAPMLNPHRAVVFLAKRSREKVGEGSEAILTSAPPVEFQPRRRSSRETSEMAWGVLDPSSSGRALVCFPRASCLISTLGRWLWWWWIQFRIQFWIV